jgi:tRNA dimethylallyltransferase
MNQLITVLGPTATGKTSLAAALAALIGGEIISADSRQVYRGMDLGTGKDIKDYNVGGLQIPHHLIDIHDPGYEYNIFEFQNDFIDAYQKIQKNESIPILCGGSGMYLDSILRAYEMKEVPENLALREELEGMTTKRLEARLKLLSDLHNTTDIKSRERLIRAIEIAETENDNKRVFDFIKSIHSVNFGIFFDRQLIRERITERLHQRLDEGMLDEVRGLLENGFTKEQLTFYGLEYKFLTLHVVGEISYDNMLDNLNTAIHQFAKRQMTWYRRMEKHGVRINWIDGLLSTEEKLALILQKLPK